MDGVRGTHPCFETTISMVLRVMLPRWSSGYDLRRAVTEEWPAEMHAWWGEMRGDMVRCGEMWEVRGDTWRWRNAWRCVEMYVEVCGDVCGDVGRRVEMRGDVGRCVEIWGDLWRCIPA